MTDVIIDCDPGHDDAIALLLALASPELNVLGVSTVAGNQTLDKTTANAIRVLDRVRRPDVPVAAGAARPLVRPLEVAANVHGESGLDGPELPPPSRQPLSAHSVDWIAATLQRSAGPVTLVALGPLTNIALLLAHHPALDRKIERIVLMGGAHGEGNVTPAAEFNIWVDPEAARRVFESELDLTMIGLDVTHTALMTVNHAERLAGTGVAGRLVADLYGFFARFHYESYGWDGAPIHDAVAVARVIDPTLVRTVRRGVVVDLGEGPSRGRTHVDLRGAHWPATAHVAVELDVERFFALLLERIGALG
jgi:inosine-uridine nucleoside N-ribohydrolase